MKQGSGLPQKEERLNFNMKILHTGITVKDIDKAVLFYRDVIGLKVTVPPTEPADGEDLSKGVGVPQACLRQAILESGDVSIELFEYISPPAEVEKPQSVHNPGPGHIAFEVEDIQKEYERMVDLGVRFNTAPNLIESGPLSGWKWVYFRDPDGIVLELVEKG